MFLYSVFLLTHCSGYFKSQMSLKSWEKILNPACINSFLTFNRWHYLLVYKYKIKKQRPPVFKHRPSHFCLHAILLPFIRNLGLPWWLSDKESTCNSGHLCTILCDPGTVAHQAPLSMEFSTDKNTGVVAISFSRGSSWPRDRIHIFYVSCISRWILYH